MKTHHYIALFILIVVVCAGLAIFKERNFGSFTNLNLSDLQSSFPALYNANLAKTIEVGTTSVASITTLPNLASFGTITSGTWNGTAIGVSYQGTGTTSPTLNQIILGNGSSGFKVVTGFGISGQVLTSAGAGSAPAWTSITTDQTASFNFTGAYFGIKNLLASSTVANPLTLNGLTFNTPSIRAASSTVLTEDGSGNLKWIPAQTYVLGASWASGLTSSNSATTSLATVSVPAATLSSVASIEGYADFADSDADTCYYQIDYGNGTATTSAFGGAGSVNGGTMKFTINATSTTNARIVSLMIGNNENGAAGGNVTTIRTGGGTAPVAVANKSYISFAIRSVSGNCNLNGYSVRVERF